MTKTELTCVILCGGKSRRMGEDKAGLMMGEGTILQRLTKNLAPLGDLWLSVREAKDYPECPLPKVADRFLDCGPMGGLEAALSACRGELVFVTAVDLPFVDHVLAEELLEIFRQEPETDALLVTDATGRQQFLLGLYRKEVHDRLLRRLEDGSRDALRIRDFLAEIRVRFVPAGELTDGDFKTRSFNTAEEYQSLVELAAVREQKH